MEHGGICEATEKILLILKEQAVFYQLAGTPFFLKGHPENPIAQRDIHILFLAEKKSLMFMEQNLPRFFMEQTPGNFFNRSPSSL